MHTSLSLVSGSRPMTRVLSVTRGNLLWVLLQLLRTELSVMCLTAHIQEDNPPNLIALPPMKGTVCFIDVCNVLHNWWSRKPIMKMFISPGARIQGLNDRPCAFRWQKYCLQFNGKFSTFFKVSLYFHWHKNEAMDVGKLSRSHVYPQRWGQLWNIPHTFHTFMLCMKNHIYTVDANDQFLNVNSKGMNALKVVLFPLISIWSLFPSVTGTGPTYREEFGIKYNIYDLFSLPTYSGWLHQPKEVKKRGLIGKGKLPRTGSVGRWLPALIRLLSRDDRLLGAANEALIGLIKQQAWTRWCVWFTGHSQSHAPAVVTIQKRATESFVSCRPSW